MDFRTFTEGVLGLYQARKKAKCMLNGRVVRGRSAGCASDVEDLIAKAIAGMIPERYCLLVDHPFSVDTGVGRVKSYYPDIAIMDGTLLCGVVEIKSDVGYTKGNWVQASREAVETLGNAKAVSYQKHIFCKGSERVDARIVKPVQWAAVVVTGLNEHKGQLTVLREHGDRCFLLMPKHHPNWDVADGDLQRVVSEIVADASGWQRMESYFRETYK